MFEASRLGEDVRILLSSFENCRASLWIELFRDLSHHGARGRVLRVMETEYDRREAGAWDTAGLRHCSGA